MKSRIKKADRDLHAQLCSISEDLGYWYASLTSQSSISAKAFVAIHDIIWQNIKCDEEVKFFKRLFSVLVLIGLFFVLSLPSVDDRDQVFINFVKSNISFGNNFFSLSFFDSDSKALDYISKEYLPTLWVSMVNAFNMAIVYKLSTILSPGIFRKQTEFVYFHAFIFKVISFYMHFNMVFMPIVGYGSNDSSWSLIARLLAWKKVKTDFIFGTSCTNR